MDMDSSGRARMRLPTADLPPDCAAPVTSESPWSSGPGGRSLNVCDRPRSIRPCPVRSVQLSRRSPSRPSSNADRAGSAHPDGSRARRPRTGRARRRGSACGSVPAPPPACRPAAGCPRRRGQHERRNLRALHVALYGTRASPKKGIAATSKAVRMTPTDFRSTSICYSAPLPRDGGVTMSKHIAAPSSTIQHHPHRQHVRHRPRFTTTKHQAHCSIPDFRGVSCR